MTRGQRVSSCPSFSPIGYDSPAAPRTATFLSARTELEKLLLARSEVCLATDRENIVCVLGLYARSRYELENDLGVVVSNTQMLSSVGRFGHSRRAELFQMWQWEQGWGGRSRFREVSSICSKSSSSTSSRSSALSIALQVGANGQTERFNQVLYLNRTIRPAPISNRTGVT